MVAWVAQSVKLSTLDFSSGLDLRVMSSSYEKRKKRVLDFVKDLFKCLGEKL